MECPHLPTSGVCKPAIPHKGNGKTRQKSTDIQLRCKDCGIEESLWCCCQCGQLGCGRYAKAHMISHYENDEAHSVCLDCSSYAVYCYKCDEYVVNDSDSNAIQQLRSYFQCLDPSYVMLDIENKNHTRGKKRHHHSSHAGVHKKRKQHPKTVGLRNLGNTCFMNAVLQSLNNIPEFAKYIHKLPSLEKAVPTAKIKPSTVVSTRTTCSEEENVLLVEEFRKTLVELRRSRTALSPANLFAVIWKVVPTFRGYQQQDAHEFMRYLLDRLHQELLALLPQNSFSTRHVSFLAGVKTSVVTAVFGGVLQSEVRCLSCGVSSVKHDPFLDLSLDIPVMKSGTIAEQDDDPIAKICTIQDCLRSFTDTEELEDTERYMCGHCKKRQRSTKKFWIRRLPKVLCLHLKRFRWSSFLRTKIETYVEFPINDLDMSGYQLNVRRTRDSTGSAQYDLAAVVVHHGSGAGSGHYTSYATHDQTWYHFNDSSVTAVSEDIVTKSKAYILFYIRKELKL